MALLGHPLDLARWPLIVQAQPAGLHRLLHKQIHYFMTFTMGTDIRRFFFEMLNYPQRFIGC